MTTKKLKAITVSEARTGWDLLVDVKRAMREEPLRVDMRTWRRRKLPTQGGPACGTVGCFAGWVSMKAGYKRINSGDIVRHLLGDDRIINYVLPGTNGVESVFNIGRGDTCDFTTPGTRRHATAVIRRIDGFMQRNKAELKARKLKLVRGKLRPVVQ